MFLSHAEIRRNAAKNLSLSVGRIKTNEGAAALSWNLSAPCRLETEVWPCQMAVSVGGDCSEVPGFRQIISTGWEENISMVWVSVCVRMLDISADHPDGSGMVLWISAEKP